jgi:holo-[acyl-carrier protein] synthase
VVIGIGLDLVETARVERALERFGDRFVGKLMDRAESDRLPPSGQERVAAVAAAVALKEAASKALGTGWSQGVRWRDVVVSAQDPPQLRLHARALEVALSLGSSGRTHARCEARGALVVGEVWLLK